MPFISTPDQDIGYGFRFRVDILPHIIHVGQNRVAASIAAEAANHHKVILQEYRVVTARRARVWSFPEPITRADEQQYGNTQGARGASGS